jgi:hypothetical protein
LPDPIDPAHGYAEPEVQALRQQTIDWRAADEARNDERAKLNQLILDCRAAGISFERIRSVTGMGIATIQMVIAKAGQ